MTGIKNVMKKVTYGQFNSNFSKIWIFIYKNLTIKSDKKNNFMLKKLKRRLHQ